MESSILLQKIREAVAGRYINLTKVKDLGEGVTKETDMVIRLGVDYSHMAINKGKEIQPLKWGHWVPGLEKLVIEHTKVDKKTGEELETNYYLRITSCDPEHPESGADVIETRYYYNGVQITREQALEIVGEKKMQSSASAVYDIKFSNIVSLGA